MRSRVFEAKDLEIVNGRARVRAKGEGERVAAHRVTALRGAEAPAPTLQTLFVPGRLPGLNEVLAAANKRAGKWNGYDQLKREWGERLVMVIRQAKLQPMDRVSVTFVWHEPNMKRDKDNVAMGKKFVLDALVTAKILQNDGWRHVDGFTDGFLVDKANPGVTVTLTPSLTRRGA